MNKLINHEEKLHWKFFLKDDREKGSSKHNNKLFEKTDQKKATLKLEKEKKLEPRQYAWRDNAAARIETKLLRAINVRHWCWIHFAELSRTSARLESKIPIWPALRNTFVFPIYKNRIRKQKNNKITLSNTNNINPQKKMHQDQDYNKKT